jgi:predicted methyltransferase
MKKITTYLLLTITALFAQTLDSVVSGKHRSQKNKARDQYRHPIKTLNFFGIKNDMTVVELNPGSGWYQEILAPFLKDNGRYVTATYDSDTKSEYRRNSYDAEMKRIKANKKIYGEPRVVQLSGEVYGEEESADMVLSFRNYHNWIGSSEFEKLRAIYKTLKPGGIFGITDHRSDTTADQKGYTCEPCMIRDAEAVGFVYVSSSQINANPKDTKDYPGGVWNLPPTLRDRGLKKTEIKKMQSEYKKIGESDRYTLKFMKP